MALVTLAQLKVFLRIPAGNTSDDDFLTMLLGDATETVYGYIKRRLEQDVYTQYYQGNGTKFIILKQRPVQAVLNVWVDYNGYYGQGVNPDATLPFAATTLQTLGTYALVLDETINGPNPPAWSSVTAYLPGTLVTSAGLFYSCLTANTNQVPPNANWTPGMADLLVSKSGLLASNTYNWPDIGTLYIPGNLAREGGQFLGNIKVQYVAGYPTGFIPADLQFAVRALVVNMRQTAARGGQVQSESITDYSYSLVNPSLGEAPDIGSIRQILNRYREIPGMGGDLAALPSNNSGGWR